MIKTRGVKQRYITKTTKVEEPCLCKCHTDKNNIMHCVPCCFPPITDDGNVWSNVGLVESDNSDKGDK
jgi:hypothetical protein